MPAQQLSIIVAIAAVLAGIIHWQINQFGAQIGQMEARLTSSMNNVTSSLARLTDSVEGGEANKLKP